MRNTASYCDGLSREFTVRFTDHMMYGRTLYAAVAGQTCSDPLDCLAMTKGEAASLVAGLTGFYLGMTGEVIPLPAGWSNDGTTAAYAEAA